MLPSLMTFSTAPTFAFSLGLALGVSAAATDDREAALLKAMSSVQNAAERAAQDSQRPSYHFRPPGNWMNDPNGPLLHDGWYHMFYQTNPYDDRWENMHWGHARSRDLVRWEHLPMALWPSKTKGEQHCFSGCATLDGAGNPLIFYTSIGHPQPHCWIAKPEDAGLVRWRKFEGNPVLTEKSPGIPYYDFRDPFVFRHGSRTFMVHGGNLNQAKGGQAVVSLYEAEDTALEQWKYRGILFRHPDPKVVNIECPNFFALDGKYVLITSPHRTCDYFVGDFDPDAGTFTARQQGVVDAGHFYAPNTLLTDPKRLLLWGWVNGFTSGKGWNGCLTLARVLGLREGHLVQTPAPEIESLRGQHWQGARVSLADKPVVLDGVRGTMLELKLDLRCPEGGKAGVRVRRSDDGIRGVAIIWDGETLEAAGTKLKLPGAPRSTLPLRIFLDQSVLEVYAADGLGCITRVITPEARDLGVEVFAEGGAGTAGPWEAWSMKPAW